MPLELVASNTVIVAQQFNPSVVSQLWLVRNRIVAEDDFRPGCVFTDMLVQVDAREFQLVVVPPQCQFSPQVDAELQQDLVVERVGGIVRALPHTPYRGIGLNFIWHLTPEDADVPTVSRSLFFCEGGPIHREFLDGNARFGAYLSKDAFGARLKLDAKPIIVNQNQDSPQERIQFAFNFHMDVDVNDDPVECIDSLLRRWNEVRDESSRIVNLALREQHA